MYIPLTELKNAIGYLAKFDELLVIRTEVFSYSISSTNRFINQECHQDSLRENSNRINEIQIGFNERLYTFYIYYACKERSAFYHTNYIYTVHYV